MGYYKLVILLLTGFLFANVDEYISKIDIYVTKSEFQNAADLFDKSLLEYNANAKLYFVGAQISIKMDDLDQANKYFVKAIELDTKNEEYRDAQEKLAELKDDLTKARKTFDIGLIEDAIIEYEKLAKKYPEHAIVFYI